MIADVSTDPNTQAPVYSYIGTNAHGDVTWTADATGAVSCTSAYDPFGNRIAETGSLPSSGWQGSLYDSNTRLYYVVARWYSPTLGRFLSVDPKAGSTNHPQSLDRYAYVSGNPLGGVDPFGTCNAGQAYDRNIGGCVDAGGRATVNASSVYQAHAAHTPTNRCLASNFHADGCVSGPPSAKLPASTEKDKCANTNNRASGCDVRITASPDLINATDTIVAPIAAKRRADDAATLRDSAQALEDDNDCTQHFELCKHETATGQYRTSSRTTVIDYETSTGVTILIGSDGIPLDSSALDETQYDCQVEHNNTSCALWNAWGGPKASEQALHEFAHLALAGCAALGFASGVGAPAGAACLGGDAALNVTEGNNLAAGLEALAILLPGAGQLIAGGDADATVAVASIEDANWAQKAARFTFSAGGRFPGVTIDELAANLANGVADVDAVPVDVIVRNGSSLIVNSRSSVALEQAGIPRYLWNWRDMTGVLEVEDRLTNQIARYGLDWQGTDVIRITGR